MPPMVTLAVAPELELFVQPASVPVSKSPFSTPGDSDDWAELRGANTPIPRTNAQMTKTARLPCFTDPSDSDIV